MTLSYFIHNPVVLLGVEKAVHYGVHSVANKNVYEQGDSINRVLYICVPYFFADPTDHPIGHLLLGDSIQDSLA